MKEIKIDTTIATLLNDYDNMKEILIDINPKFKKLNNPILRRTLAKLATVKQAAIIGGMQPLDLLNRLREAVGQEPIDANLSEVQEDTTQEAPSWLNLENVKQTLDASELLDNQKNPLAEVNIALKKADSNAIIALKSDFMPEPLIEEFKKQGKSLYCKKINDDEFITYIKQ
jgi:hypothetical protein